MKQHLLARLRRQLRHAIFVPGTEAQVHALIPLFNLLSLMVIVGTIFLMISAWILEPGMSIAWVIAPLVITILVRGLAWIGDSNDPARMGHGQTEAENIE